MRAVVALALIGLVLGSQLTLDMSRKLNDLADHPFSKTMVSMVNMNMQTGGPLNDLLELLKQIKDELVQLTQIQDAEWQTSQRRCDVDIAQLSATLTQSSGDLEAYRTEQADLVEELNGLASRIKDDTAALERNARSQTETADRLAAESVDFERIYADYSLAIQACKEAQRLLNNFRTEGVLVATKETELNFLQTKEQMTELKTMLEKHIKGTQLAIFTPIIEGLVDLSGDPLKFEVLNNVLSLIARLITILQGGLDDIELAHNSQTADIRKLAADLASERVTLLNSLQSATNRQKEIQARLNELDELLRETNEIVLATTANLADAKASCKGKEDEYNVQNVNRQSETDIVDRLIEFVTERIANAPGN